jgi:D-threo-aldose 1-dehydrogenase
MKQATSDTPMTTPTTPSPTNAASTVHLGTTAGTETAAPAAALSRLGLGGAAIGNLFHPVRQDDARALLDRAWSDGCRRYDTAPHYGHGLSEHRMGEALRARPRADYTLSSKVGRLLTPSQTVPREQFCYVDGLPFVQHWDFSVDGTRRSVEDSLQRLGLSRLDIAYVHDMDAQTHGADGDRVLRQVLDETLPTLVQLRREGLVGAIGLGVNDEQAVLQALRHADLDAVLIAGRYSLLDHAALPEMLPQCLARGVRVSLGGVFNSGLLATGARQAGATFNYQPAAAQWLERTAQIEAVCERHHVPLRAAALQFPLAHAAVTELMLGARRQEEWDDGLAMLAHPIPDAFWDELQHEHLLPEQAPVPGAR